MITPRRPGVVLAVLVVALGACSGRSEGGHGTVSPTPDDLDLTSPLDPYLDELWGDRSQGDPDPWALRYEEVTAACMAEQGFEYHIDELAGAGATRIPDDAGTVAFAEQYGYGESIPFEDGDVPLMWNEVPIGEGRAWNDAYRVGLSPQALAAYDVALDGSYSESSPDYPVEGEYDPARNGCRGRATIEVYSDGWAGPPELGEMKRAVADVWRRVEEDPRVLETLAQWSACMADAGHPGLTQIIDAQNLFASDIWPAWQDEWAAATGTDLGVTDYDVVRLQIPDGLAELRQAEVDLAVADARCREDSGYLAAHQLVEREVEQEVVDMYRTDLDAWVAWIQENGGAVP